MSLGVWDSKLANPKLGDLLQLCLVLPPEHTKMQGGAGLQNFKTW